MPWDCGELLHLTVSKLGSRRERYIIDSVLADPMEALDKQQGNKHDHETGVELISKHCHGQERFRHCKPGSLAQMSLLYRSQMAKEYLLNSKAEENCDEDAHICQYHETGIALREIDTCRVEIRPLLERGKNDSRC